MPWTGPRSTSLPALQISPPNAAYKVQQPECREGYLKKGAEPGGQAEYRLVPFPKILCD